MQNPGGVPILAQGLPVSYQQQQDAGTTQIIVQAPMVTATTQIEEAHRFVNSTTNNSTGIISGGLSTVQTAGGADPNPDPESIETDKRSIYRHPLFPLMALLFEKCEQATQTTECPSSVGFDVDIQAFVHHQEQDGKPFFSDDPDLDALLVKAIQVLRIHLLELEKVNELCKDFCARYISCLKGKLQSENLLRVDGMPGLDGTLDNISTGLSGDGAGLMVQQPQQSPTQQTSVPLGPGQIVSGGTVYQMVQTPQGLVAQPIQIQTSTQLGQCSSPLVQGNTSLSQIGVATTPVSQPPQVTSPLLNSPQSYSDDEDSGKRRSKRGVLPKQATQVMKSWLFQHIVHPYPTEDEKRQLASQTNLTLLQVNNWFINARRRILQPMLDASNPEGAKAKKTKPQNRPTQRFWPDSIASIQPQMQKSGSENELGEEQDSLDTDEEEEEEEGRLQVQAEQQQQVVDNHEDDKQIPQPQALLVLTPDGQLVHSSVGATGAINLMSDGSGLVSMANMSHILAQQGVGMGGAAVVVAQNGAQMMSAPQTLTAHTQAVQAINHTTDSSDQE